MTIQEKYNVSHELMAEILHRLCHPSREDAAARAQVINRIKASTEVRKRGLKRTVVHKDLDLSFLDSVMPEPKKEYSFSGNIANIEELMGEYICKFPVGRSFINEQPLDAA